MNDLDDDLRRGLEVWGSTMNSTPPPIDQIVRAASEPRRRSPRPIVVGVVVGAVGIGAGAVAASGILSDPAADMLSRSPCGDVDDARLVASAQDSHGWTHDYWILDNDARGFLMILTDPDGQPGGTGLGCSPGLDEPVERSPDAASAGGSFPDDQDTSVALAGWIPQWAASAIINFKDGTSATVEAGADGYFAAMIEEHSGRTRGVASIDLLDDDGTLIERQHLDQP